MTQKRTYYRLTRRKLLAAGGIVFMVFAASLCALTFAVMSRHHTPQRQASRPMLQVGQIGQSGNITLRVDSVREDAIGDPGYTPGVAMHYVVPMISLRNNGQSAVSIAPVIQAYLRDAQGQIYQMSPAPTSKPFIAGDVSPGISSQGEISFDVPDVATGLVMYYQTGQFQPVAIALGR